MKEWLNFVIVHAVVIINAMALLVVLFGTIEAFILGLRAMIRSSASGHDLRQAYLRYAHWLIAGLTFQLAADIIETAMAPSWDEIGRLAAVAVIRTFLNYFLDRDLKGAAETSPAKRLTEPPKKK